MIVIDGRSGGMRAARSLLLQQPLVATRQLSILSILVWIGFLGGALLVTYSYAYAATEVTGQVHYQLFWLGVLLFIVPAFLRLCASDASRVERLAIITAIGLFSYLPKFLRDPQSPLYFDELSHWRQAEMILRTGRLFLPNPQNYMNQYFPGLETLTAALRDLTGMPTFTIGTILISVLHVIGLVGIFVIAEGLTHSARSAGLAAFIYSLNPSFMYFDSQYSYESVAIFILIWVIAAVINMQAAEGDRPRQGAWFVAGLLLAAACIVTHHLSTIMMVTVLVLITGVTWISVHRGVCTPGNALVTTIFTIIASLAAVAWFVLISPQVFTYLGQPLTRAFAELSRILNAQQPARQLFARSTTPSYEHWAAYAAPVLLFFGAGYALYSRWYIHMRSPAGIALIAFGTLYIASLPAMLTQAGNEGARRSWAFTYIGLSVLLAPVIPRLLKPPRRPLVEALTLGCLVVFMSIVLVGNVSAQTNEYYRFPGPYVYGSDARSITSELLQTTQWFRRTEGINNTVVADRYTGQVVASFGLDWTPRAGGALPLWELYESPAKLSSGLLDALVRSHSNYLVVDRQMSRHLPYLGVYFNDEPTAVIRKTPPTAEAIKKFEQLPWTIKVYQSDNLSVYRFNFAALTLSWKPTSVTRVRPSITTVHSATVAGRRIGLNYAFLTIVRQRIDGACSFQTLHLANHCPGSHSPALPAPIRTKPGFSKSMRVPAPQVVKTVNASSISTYRHVGRTASFPPSWSRAHGAGGKWLLPLNDYGQ
jgi:hypothetical protein